MKKKKVISVNGCPTCNMYLSTDHDKSMTCHSSKVKQYDLAEVMFDGKPYLKAPVTMMTEGVHVGSQGAAFYSAAELADFAEAWNGRPVPVFHPEQDGQGISANSPEVLEAQSIGFVFDAHFDEQAKALKADIWIDPEKAAKISPVTLEMLKAGQPIDVSTGEYRESTPQKGVWNGEAYEWIASNIRPDHLALLPGGIGACSWKDGCGVRTNEQKETEYGFAVNRTADYSVVRDEVAKAIAREVGGKNKWIYIPFINDSQVIYEVEQEEKPSQYFKADYTFNDGTHAVTIGAQRTEVIKVTSFIDKADMATNSINVGGAEESSSITVTENSKGGIVKKKLVDALIANEALDFVEADREALEALSEEVLTKMVPKEAPKQETPALNAQQAAQKAVDTLKSHFQNSADFLKLLPSDVQESVSHGLSMYKEKRAELTALISTNSKFTEDMLKEKSLEELNMLAELATPKPLYFGEGGQTRKNVETNASADQEFLLPIGVSIKAGA